MNLRLTLLFFCAISFTNSFAQTPCEVLCTVTNQLVNICTDCDVVIAADNCADASTPYICGLDGLRTTICGGTPDGPDDLFQFCGPGTSISNNIWIGFTAAFSGRLQIQIEILECLSANQSCNGVQAAVARALCRNPGNEFFGFDYQTLDCQFCGDQTFELTTVDAIQGVPHYIMIDPCCADICEIVVHVIDGNPDPGWTIASITPSLVTNNADPNCFDQASSLIAVAEGNLDADPNAELIFTWYDPDNEILFSGSPNDGTNTHILTGINPITGAPYICKDGTYSVELKALDTCCKDIEEIDIQGTPNAVQNSIDESFLTIFPNPTSNILNLQFSEDISDYESIQIFNNKGKAMKIDIDSKKESINLITLKAGFYILRITLKDGSFVIKKIIKL